MRVLFRGKLCSIGGWRYGKFYRDERRRWRLELGRLLPRGPVVAGVAVMTAELFAWRARRDRPLSTAKIQAAVASCT